MALEEVNFIFKKKSYLFDCALVSFLARGIWFPNQGSTLGPLPWELGVLATEPAGKSGGEGVWNWVNGLDCWAVVGRGSGCSKEHECQLRNTREGGESKPGQ